MKIPFLYGKDKEDVVMKKRSVLLSVMLLIVLAVAISGCGGQTSTVIRKDADGAFRHEGTSYSLMPVPSPEAMARADALFTASRSQENLTAAFEERMRKETAALEAAIKSGKLDEPEKKSVTASYNYVLVVKNLTPQLHFVHHPEWGSDLPLAPSTGFAILELKTLPPTLIVKNQRKEIVWEPPTEPAKTAGKKKFMTRDDVDLVIRIKGNKKGSS